MMTSLIFAFLAAAPQAEPITAGGLISKMFVRYATAKTLSGVIDMVQTAQGKSVGIRSELQYEYPSRVFIRQTRTSSEPRAWLVTSDGVNVSYDRPEGVMGAKRRLVDPVNAPSGPMDVKDIYLAVSLSLGSKPAPLDIAFGRTEDLRVIKALWGNLSIAGKTDYKDRKLNVVRGSFRESYGGPFAGSLELLISDEGDLVRLKTAQTVMAATINQPIAVSTTYECALVANGEVNAALFNVVR